MKERRPRIAISCRPLSLHTARESRTVVDQFGEDMAINKGAGPFAVVGGSWFGGDDFLERFAFLLQRGDAIVNRYQHVAVIGQLRFASDFAVPGMTIILSVTFARFDSAA